MCGIVAFLGPEPGARVAEVRRRAEMLRHRGPDEVGLVVAGRTVLGHQRLSIIDVAHGHQPFVVDEGRLAMVCNGEIYNHEDVRRRLAGRHRFRTRSDSEVVLHLYEELGTDCVQQLDGMFAFVLVDGEHVVAARDPLGIKPLYVGWDSDGGTWFASEAKALVGACRRIEEVPPGSVYTDRDGFRRWWNPAWRAPAAGRRPMVPDLIAPALERAVEKRLMSDVPLGVFLSGGLDSSVIAAVTRRHIERLHSFAVGLEGSEDVAAARVVARHLGTRHHELCYRPADVVDALETVIQHLESYDPALIRSAIPCYFVSRLAADYVKVALSGEGSDEAFAGYLYFREVGDPGALHAESVRLLDGLHNINLQRVDRMTMAHALEGRVPFLDVDFLDVAMGLDPRSKLHRPDRPEKWLLRRAFDGVLPDAVLWRTKQEFAQGAGSEWTVRDHCEAAVSDADFARAATRFPVDPPATKEAYLYRRIFEEHFPGESLRQIVGRWQGTATTTTEETAPHA